MQTDLLEKDRVLGVRKKLKICVVGLGNECFGDDGIGSALVRALELENAEKVIAGIKGLQTAFDVLDCDVVVFIDASFTLNKDYELRELEPKEGYDPHSSSPAEILAFMKSMGFKGKAYVLEIRGERACFPCTLSDEVIRRAKESVKELEKLGIRIKGVGEVAAECKQI